MFSCCRAAPDYQADFDVYFAIRPEYQNEAPVTRFKPKPGKTLSARKWHSSFSEEGQIDMAKVLNRIQNGGIVPSIKGAVWEFLLGCYDPTSTFDERSQLRQQRRDQYAALKTECKGMEPTVGSGNLISTPIISEDGRPVQESTNGDNLTDQDGDVSLDLNMQSDVVETDQKVIQWKLTLHQIGLDVLRTDRTLVYYQSQSNLARLWDILAIYSWIDGDIGYCQGMSDLCSPISILIENEADAFWCFQHLMRRVDYFKLPAHLLFHELCFHLDLSNQTDDCIDTKRENFKCTVGSIGVRSQLTVLAAIMNVIDPKLHQHIEELDGGEYLFAFRMLMVLFRREFSLIDAIYLWELIWAMEYNPKLFSSYESNSQEAMQNGSDNTELLKQCGKFEKKNMLAGSKRQQGILPVFVVASVLEAKNQLLLAEAKGLDDVVKILNDITGSMDAKKACNDALKIHQRYLDKVKTE